MSGSIINLNGTSPAARAGMSLVKWQKGASTGVDPDTGLPVYPVSAEAPNSGGVNPQTATYTIADGDNGKLVTMTSADASVLNLPASLIAGFRCCIANLGEGDCTLTPASGTIDGAATLVLQNGQGCKLFWDGANYVTEHGMGSGGSFPYPVHSGVTLTDGETLQYSSATGKFEPVTDKPTQPTSAVVGQPLAGQLVLIYTCATAMRFDANFAGSKGSVGVNPASTAVYTIYKNGVQCGTISISTSGVFTFASSSGNAVALNAQDRLTVIAPNPQDGALSDVGFTLVAQRSSVFPPGEALPIYVFRDTYDNAATYQPYELVTYEGSTYMARSATTGNAPSTGGVVDSHWAAIALAGAAGGVQVSQDIGGTAASPIVVGLQGKGLDSGVGSPSDGDILVYDGELGKWKAGAAGLTGFDFGMQPCGFASGSSLNASNFAGLLLVVPYATAIKSVKFVAASAAATAKIYPAIYEFSNGALGALLATGPQVTGVTAGLNSIPLTSALSVSAGQLIAVGLVVSVANISLANCPGYGSCWFSCSGAPPNPASTTSFGTSGWASMWAGVI